MEPSPHFDMQVARLAVGVGAAGGGGPASRAIISITLEYKMRVINFITNYVGPGRGTLQSDFKSQLELDKAM